MTVPESEIDASEAIPCGLPRSVWQDAVQAPERIILIEHESAKLWLKKCSAARGKFGYWVLNKVSAYVKAPLFKAVPQPGGQKALANEVRRLQILKSAGITVPDVLWHNEDMALISDIGSTLRDYLEQHEQDTQHKISTLKKVFSELNTLHKRKQYLSQNFARNVMIAEIDDELCVGFIDFEDDPCEVMSLKSAQARDILLLIYTLGRYYENCQSEYRQLVFQQLNLLSDDVDIQLKNTVVKLRWLAKVPGRKYFSKDYWRFIDILNVLSEHLGLDQ